MEPTCCSTRVALCRVVLRLLGFWASAAPSHPAANADKAHSHTHHDSHGSFSRLITLGRMKPTGPVSDGL